MGSEMAAWGDEMAFWDDGIAEDLALVSMLLILFSKYWIRCLSESGCCFRSLFLRPLDKEVRH